MPSLFPILLTLHVSLAIALFVPSLVLPFTLRSRGAAPNPGRFVRLLLWLQAHGTVVIGAGLALTGIAMLIVLGPTILSQPWLLVALGTYAVTAIVAFGIQRPGLARLLGRGRGRTDAEQRAWREGTRRQRYIAYAITTAVGFIAFLMSTKPVLW
jgi:hypothetical protein